MRVAKACTQCRAVKRKCRSDSDLGPCTQCRQKGLSCSLQSDRTPSDAPYRPLAPADSPELLPAQEREHLVNLYLELLHGKPHTLFHPDRLRRAATNGPVTPTLLAIAGLACRFSPTPTVLAKQHEYMDAARHSLKLQIDDCCLDTLRACILVGNLYGAEGDSNIESVFFAVAFRIAHIIKLPNLETEDDDIAREEKVRAWWSLYMVDRWSSAGLDVPRQMPDDRHIPLPMDELDFYAMKSNGNTSIIHHPRHGLWAEMVRLARGFGQIQDLHRKYADGDLNTFEVERLTGELSAQIDGYIEMLHPHLRLTESNLRQHASQGLGRDFVALHLGYFHYATLLHFPYLDMQLEATYDQTQYALRCKENAAALSDLLSLSWQIDGCKPVYFVVAHMITVSSSALLHDLLFGDAQTLADTRRRLEANFQALVELRNLWPAAAMMTNRLFTFQTMCHRSADPNTHKADKWMVKFLLQHGSPIDDKTISSLENTSPTLVSRDRGRFANDALSVLR